MDMIGKKNLGGYFEELALTHKNKTAIICEDVECRTTSLSYVQLNEQINQTANLLTHMGLKKGDKVIIHLCNSIEYIVNFIAIAKIGAISVPVNANYVYADTLFMVEKTKPTLVITNSKFVHIYDDMIENNFTFKNGIMLVDNCSCKHTQYQKEFVKYSVNFENNDIDNLDTAEIVFTSGTSSFPKGVEITHYNLIFAGFYTSWQGSFDNNDICLTAMPLWHIDAQCTMMMPAFSRGATFVLIEKYSAHKFWDQVLFYKATITECIPKMICTLMAQPIKDNEKKHNLKEMFFYLNINNKDMTEFLDRFNIPSCLNSYGMTETIVGLIGDRPNEKRRFPSIGKLGFCYEAKILDSEGNELLSNKSGEICIKGEIGKTIFKGYFDNKDATNKVLSKDGWLKTGDIGYFDDDEYFYFVDRNINLIKVAGENVSSVEVETFISSHDKIFEVAVIGIPDKFNNELIKACVVLKDKEEMTKDDVVQYCLSGLAKFKVPSIVQFYSYLPKTCTGKVRKNILRSDHLKENLK